MTDPAAAAALRRLELTVVRRLDGLLHGEHLGLLPGPGSESAEARLYRPGEDDVRRMDWSVTARTSLPHVRDQVADRELETIALVDLSASMDFGTAAMDKRELATAALAAVGFLTTRHGDRFGAEVLTGGRVVRWPARPGRRALHALLRALVAVPRTGPEPVGGATFADALADLARVGRRRGLRVVVSDFLAPATAREPAPAGGDGPAGPAGEYAFEAPLRRLAARHQVLAIEVVDPRELELPGVGLVTFTDPETGGDREVYLSGRVRRRYAELAARQRAGTLAALRRCGVPHLVLRTDRDWVFDIARFVLRHRRVARRGAGGAGQRDTAVRTGGRTSSPGRRAGTARPEPGRERP